MRLIDDEPHQRLLLFPFLLFPCEQAGLLLDVLELLVLSSDHSLQEELFGDEADNKRPHRIASGESSVAAHIQNGDLAGKNKIVYLGTYLAEEPPLLGKKEEIGR